MLLHVLAEWKCNDIVIHPKYGKVFIKLNPSILGSMKKINHDKELLSVEFLKIIQINVNSFF